MVERQSQARASAREVIEVAGSNHAIGVILNLAWGPNNFSPSMIWSWRTRSNSRTGLGAELFLPAKSTFCFCGLFYFFLYYRHYFSFFLPYLFFFAKKLCFLCFFLYGFGTCRLVFFPFLLFYLFFLLLSTPGKILAESHHIVPITTFSTIFSHRYQISLWSSKPCIGAASGRYFERMESPATLLRSSKASMTTSPALLVMVTSYLKSTLVSEMDASCPHCFSITL